MILIVDDIPDGAEVMCTLLTRLGYPCKWASGGQEALALIRSHPPESPLLVLLDEMMPDLCGIDVLRSLRHDPATVHVPVVMFSAGLNVAKREEAMALGVADWILKGQDVIRVTSAIAAHYERVGGVKNASRSDATAG
jgi:CheY-like chemotaxis protein